MVVRKRFVFNNLIYYLNKDEVLLVNLLSFRRQRISMSILSRIIEIENKINKEIFLSEEENKMLNGLYSNKQVLAKNVLLEIKRNLQDEPDLSIDKFTIKLLTLNLTHECNFRCLYCYQNNYKDKPEYKQSMTVNDIDLIKEYLSQDFFDTSEIEEIMFSGGESLLPQNIDTINYTLNNVQSKKFSLLTNGVNLFDYRQYIDYNLIDEFQISFDGTDEIIKHINQNTGSKIFEKILDGIKYVESLNKKISIIIMWTKELENHIDEFIFLLKQNNIIKKDNMEIVVSLIRDSYSLNMINENFYNLDYLCKHVKKINSKLLQIGSFIEVYNDGALLNYLIHKPINKRNHLRYKRCNLAKSIPMIFEPSGEVFWCSCLGNKNGCIGNYKGNTYFDKDKVLKFGNRSIFKIEKCKSCEVKYLCAGGCPLPLTSSENDLYQPVCGLYGLDEFWDRLEELI